MTKIKIDAELLALTQMVRPWPREYSLRDLGWLQERLNEQIDIALEDLFRRDDDDHNARLTAVQEGWKAGRGEFAKTVGEHIEAVCDAFKRAMAVDG